MKVMLIFPPDVAVIEPFRSAKAKPPPIMWGFPLGLGYLAAVLKKDDFEVSMLDACLDKISIEDILSQVQKYQPHIVGIGALTHILKTAVTLAERIKERHKNIKVVMGGPHATYDYESLLNLGCIDYIVTGEGEITFLELCNRLKHGEPVNDIRGIAFRNEAGKVQKTDWRPLIADLDTLPFPDRDLVDFTRYIKSYGVLEKSVDVMASRGCTNVCAFCSSGHFFRRWRSRSPENIIAEIRELVQKYPGTESINFMDDNFTADKSRVIALCKTLVNSGLNKYGWVCLARVDQLDEEMVWEMKSAGCRRVHLGIESGSNQILKNINKRISLDQARKSVSLLNSAKIEAYSFFMIGNPGETRETIELTRRFAGRLESANTGFFITQVFPGTRLEQLQPVESWPQYLYEPEINNPSIFTHPCVPNFIPDGFNREKLKKICSKISKEFIFRHFRKRYILFIKKFLVEPRLTFRYLISVFFKK